MKLNFLPPVMVPVAKYSDPNPQLEQPTIAMPRKGNEVWAVPFKLDSQPEWATTAFPSDLVRVPIHASIGGYNTPDACSVSMVAAAVAFAMEAINSFRDNIPPHAPDTQIDVQLFVGDAIHQFGAGVLGPDTPAMFRFYVGMAFRMKE